ncbi:unnamed protein product, partial [Ranitomeya imitator]
MLSSAVQAADSAAKDAMRGGPAMTSRSCDRDVITGPELIPTLGLEADACTAHKRQGPSEGFISIRYYRKYQRCLHRCTIDSMVLQLFGMLRPSGTEAKDCLARTPEKREQRYPRNVINNQKYNFFTFLPGILFNQFKYFFNLYFLLLACSQFVPEMRLGPLYTFWVPLGFVLAVTIIREAVEEIRCLMRDKEVNSQIYSKLTTRGTVKVRSSSIQVGDLVIVEKNQRIPADMIFLRTSEKNGSCFLRTDQLDGETDWKLRLPVSCTQRLPTAADLLQIRAYVYAEEPNIDIHNFAGTFTREDSDPPINESLSIENTLWASTGLWSEWLFILAGEQRSVMNTSNPRSKIGLFDLEVNCLTKILFSALVVVSLVMVSLQHFAGRWYLQIIRFLLLFSNIIPISLRVNLDMGKIVYSWMIRRDPKIPGTVVRSSTIPEQLGRISYLLTDKTGTLTQNEMVFKRLHLGTVAYGMDSMDEVQSHIFSVYTQPSHDPPAQKGTTTKVRKTMSSRVYEAVKGIALCHNVTPSYESNGVTDQAEAERQFEDSCRVYQASSPDEVALVQWTESVGLTLVGRDQSSMQLRTPGGQIMNFTILQIFPFTYESKRMGIIVRDKKLYNILSEKSASFSSRTDLSFSKFMCKIFGQ